VSKHALKSLLPLWLTLLMVPLPAVQADDDLRERLRHRLETLNQPGEMIVAGQPLLAGPAMNTFYEQRGWRPVWFTESGQPLARLDSVSLTIDLADKHGLVADHYHRQILDHLLRELESGPGSAGLRVDVELLATDSLMALGHHLAFGRIDPETIDPGWMIEREPANLMTRLASTPADAEMDLRTILQSLLPRHDEYHTLVERLALQRIIMSGGRWEPIEAGPALRPGDQSARLILVRDHLLRLGDLAVPTDGEEIAAEIFDRPLDEAVRRFQRRHGLEVDGVIGRNTLAALNTSPQDRIDQLRANLERWRWLPPSLGDEFILVNIAGFDMRVVSSNRTRMQQRVIVGQPYRRTPVFVGRMSYLVLNPSWEVPHKLAVQDQLPKIRANLNYLDDMGFALLQGWGSDEVRVDPQSVDWSTLSARNFPFRLRQAPGPENALGQVKFMFPNRYNVYLHDSPARGLFSLEDRARSSGCIRLEQPHELTRWLLTERSSLRTIQQLDAILESGRETTIRLDRPLAVYLLYWTAWVDEDDQVHYRRDVYDRDRALIQALNQPPASPASINH
jgi:L,D-transpeptidase YcbB